MRKRKATTKADVDDPQFQRDVEAMVAEMYEAYPNGVVISLVLPPPPPPSPAPDPAAVLAIQTRVADYLKLHPDTIQGTAKRPTYSLEFVGLMLELMRPGGPGENMSYGHLADAAGIEPKVLYDWVHNHKTHRIRLLR